MTPAVKVKLAAGAICPQYQTAGAAGCDLHALEDTELPWGFWTPVRTGVSLEIPPGWEAQARGRSGLALRAGMATFIGTIDSDYRGEVHVLMQYMGAGETIEAFRVKAGDRIAQLVFSPAPQMRLEVVEELSQTERGANGFGSTGVGALPAPATQWAPMAPVTELALRSAYDFAVVRAAELEAESKRLVKAATTALEHMRNYQNHYAICALEEVLGPAKPEGGARGDE